jgi:hypothetical protein
VNADVIEEEGVLLRFKRGDSDLQAGVNMKISEVVLQLDECRMKKRIIFYYYLVNDCTL